MIPEGRLAEVAPINLRRITIPPEVLDRLERFLVDKRSGIVHLNIQCGRIIGARVEEIVAVKGGSGRES